MLGERERIQIIWREKEMLDKVVQDLTTLKKIDPKYAKRIIEIFTYSENKANRNYTDKIIKNSQKLDIEFSIKENWVQKYGVPQTGKVIRQSSYVENRISAVFITNPMGKDIEKETYQHRIDRTGNKDIDGQSTQNKTKIKNIQESLEWAIVHPTALSVLFLVQKTLETIDLQWKTILVAGKDGNFWSMIATILERAGAETVWFNPREFDDEEENKENRHTKMAESKPDIVVSAIRKANHFDQSYFEWFTGPIIDVTTENDGNGETVWSVDIDSCNKLPNIYIPSINGGVGTITSALLMSNFPRCIMNTEITQWVDPELFKDLEETRSYANFWLNKTSTTYNEVEKKGIEVFGNKESFNQRLNTPNFYLDNQTPRTQGSQQIKDMLGRIEHGIPG